jgi:DNA-binding transcriptional regulator YiaG
VFYVEHQKDEERSCIVHQKDENGRMTEKPFTAFLAFEMDRLFLSQERMAVLCDVSPITVYRWLHGRRKPSFLEEYALRRFLPSLGAGCAEKLIAAACAS